MVFERNNCMSDNELGLSVDGLSRKMVAATEQSHAYAKKGDMSLAAWQQSLKARVLELLAIPGLPRPAPQVRFVEEARQDGYIRRRGYMLAADGLDVPFYLLEPDPRPAGPMGLCIAAHGHGPGKVIPAGIAIDDASRALIEGGQRDYGVQAAKRGYLTIVPDWRGMGELMLAEDIHRNKGNSCQQLSMRGMHMGRPLPGQRVSDAMQFVDWGLAQDNIDASNVVMTGNSGGGTMTLFTAAIDSRITAAAPSCYFSTFADSILAMDHCPCNFVPGLFKVAEMSDLAGLVAPRPMLIIAGTKDTIFPIDAVRAGFAAARKIYTDANAADNLELYEGTAGHRYYSARVWNFFSEKR
ncbi:MAG: hypothetical protein EHM48_07115 [Planctomycetaceae bacterium]|nr:MAG: hypothetical protein EHM48_07115 [Planctomycetaceae bacterium]